MGGRNWNSKILTGFAAMAILAMIAVPAFAQKGKGGAKKTIPVKAVLVSECGTGCATDAGGWNALSGEWSVSSGSYSLLPDIVMPEYSPDEFGVQSEVLSNKTVYTLDTLDTLVNGFVGTGTRYVKLHFYFPSTVYNSTTNLPRLPDCWTGANQNQAVNWSVFSGNSTAFPDMQEGVSYGGFARLDFNVRDTLPGCPVQVFRFWLRWPNVTITLLDDGSRTGKRQWQVTTNAAGEASLEGQGGRRTQTQYYGDFRMPFQLILTEP